MDAQVVRGQAIEREFTKKTGMWRLQATDCEPEGLDKQVGQSVSKMTNDLVAELERLVPLSSMHTTREKRARA